MKKVILIILLFAVTEKIHAQPYVYIPDPVWRQYIDTVVPGAIVGNNLNTTYPGLGGIPTIDITNYGIYDLTGIQYFYGLMGLYCGGNSLTSLPPLPSGLWDLYCDHNQLTSLPSLPPNLQWLHCEYNQLSSLPALPNSLGELVCFNNNLTSLPALPQMLWMFYCDHNLLSSLPPLPSQLNTLYCSYNNLTNLPALPDTLQFLYAANNSNLWCIPNLPTNPNFYSDIGYAICAPQGTPDTWYKMADHPAIAREMATSFSIGTKCYLATGTSNSGKLNDLWEFNPVTNVWTQKANLPAAGRLQSTSFSIGNKGYVGLGQQDNPPYYLRDFWEYNPVANTWLQKANYPDSAYFGNAAFSIGNKGYVGCGQRNGYIFPNTFFEFDPVANTWTQKANFPGFGRTQAGCFTIGNKGYVCGGDWSNGLTNTCYSYNPLTNSWSPAASMPQNINEAASFSSNGKGYVSCGQCCAWNGTLVTTLQEYDPALNAWTQQADIPTLGRFRTTGCSAGGKCYVGTGEIYTSSGSYTKTNDWWEYTPACATPANVIYATSGVTFCNGDSVMLFADDGNKYKWKKNGAVISGATSKFYYAKTSGTFTCVISNACDTVTSNQISVAINTVPSATITPVGSTTICSGETVILNVPNGGNKAYQWKKGGVNISGATLSSYTVTVGGTYKVTVTNTVTGCSKTTPTGTVVTVNPLPPATITPQGPTTFCAGGSVVLQANTGAGLTYKWKKGSNYISGATLSNYTAAIAGNYRVQVTNNNGCSKTSALITVTVPCKLNESESESIFNVKVYPNPSSGNFVFDIENTNGDIISIKIYDAVGKLILNETTINSQFTIPNPQLVPGVYTAVILNGEKHRVFKLIKTL